MQVIECRTCKEAKELSCFHSTTVRGVREAQTECKVCRRATYVAYRSGERKPRTPLELVHIRYVCQIKGNAKGGGRVVEVTDSRLLEIGARCCHYCRRAPINFSSSMRKQKAYQAERTARLNQEVGHTPRKSLNRLRPDYPDVFLHGIDRVDNSLGYVEGNMVACCESCNRSKLKYSEAEFALSTLERYSWAQSFAEAYPDSLQAILERRKNEAT